MPLPPASTAIHELSVADCDRLSTYLENLSLMVQNWTVPQYPASISDFPHFEHRFKEYLRQAKLLDILTQSSLRVPAAPDDASEETKLLITWRQAMYDEKNSLVYASLQKAFMDNASGIAHIGDVQPGDGYTAWRNLIAHVDRAKSSGEHAADRKAFYHDAQRSDEDIATFATRLRTTAFKQGLGEADMIHQLYSGFRDPTRDQRVKSIVQALKDGLSFDALLAKIERILADQPSVALVDPKVPRKSYCKYCHKHVVHKPSDCYRNPSNQDSSAASKRQKYHHGPHCILCGNRGHFAPQCALKVAGQQIPQNPDGRHAQPQRAAGHQAPPLPNNQGAFRSPRRGPGRPPKRGGRSGRGRGAGRGDTRSRHVAFVDDPDTIHTYDPEFDGYTPDDSISSTMLANDSDIDAHYTAMITSNSYDDYYTVYDMSSPTPTNTTSTQPDFIEVHLDSACFDHLTNCKHVLSSYTPNTDHYLYVADKHRLKATGAGNMSFFGNVSYYPELGKTLLSEGLMLEQGWRFNYLDNGDKLALYTRDTTVPNILFKYRYRYWIAHLPLNVSPVSFSVSKDSVAKNVSHLSLSIMRPTVIESLCDGADTDGFDSGGDVVLSDNRFQFASFQHVCDFVYTDGFQFSQLSDPYFQHMSTYVNVGFPLVQSIDSSIHKCIKAYYNSCHAVYAHSHYSEANYSNDTAPSLARQAYQCTAPNKRQASYSIIAPSTKRQATIAPSSNRQASSSTRRARNVYTNIVVDRNSCQDQTQLLSKAMYAFLVLHIKLGHLSYNTLYSALRAGHLLGFPYHWKSIDVTQLPHCEVDKLCKSTKLSIRHHPRLRSQYCGQLIHVDLKGPFATKGIGGVRYWMLFSDDFSDRMFIYFLKAKSDALLHGLRVFILNELRPVNVSTFTLVSDPGTEFINSEFKQYCIEHDIRHIVGPAGNKRYGGVIERDNRTIGTKERTLRTYAGLPRHTWNLSAEFAVLLHAITPRAPNFQTPWFLWYGQHPTVKYLHLYGAECYYHNVHYSSAQAGNPSEIVRFVGYNPHSLSTLRVYRSSTGRVLETTDVQFIETPLKLISPFTRMERLHDESDDELHIAESPFHDETEDEASSASVPTSLNDDSDADSCVPSSHQASTALNDDFNPMDNHSSSQNATSVPTRSSATQSVPSRSSAVSSSLRRSTRSRTPVQRLLFYLAMVCHVYEPSFMAAIPSPPTPTDYDVHDFAYAVFDEPLSYAAARRAPDKDKWLEAMQEELEGLNKQGTWHIVDIPENANLLRTKWVFKKKRDKDGNVTRYRARLVVKGFTQKYGVDYDQTFSPVVRHSTLRIVLALCAYYGLYTRQLDVPKAFPQSDIDYDCYMHAPTGTTLPRGKCYHLLKSIYGLKQASRLFNLMLSRFLLSIKFVQCQSDTCVYYYSVNGEFAIICVYVDDILLAASSSNLADTICAALHSKFQTTDVGTVEWFLGIRIYTSPDRRVIQLSQATYIKDILNSIPNADALSISPVPMDAHVVLSTSMSPDNDIDREYMSTIPYRTVVGKLMYLMVCSRPDISFAVCTVARFLSNPGRQHWNAVLQILKYLKGTTDCRITYRRLDEEHPTLHGYADANWANYDIDTRRSHSGFVFFYVNGPVAWKSKLQTSISLSTMDSEYYCMGDSSKEGVSLHETTDEFQSPLSMVTSVSRPVSIPSASSTVPRPLRIRVDNTSSIKLAANPVFHRRSKHIAIRHHFIRELVTNNIIVFEYVPSADNVADIFTKPLRKKDFRRLRSLLMGPFDKLL